MRGIASIAGYVPYRRLQRQRWQRSSPPAGARGPARWPPTTRTPPPWGSRRPGWPSCGAGAAPEAIWFSTATPAYLDKTNAAAIHAALRQPPCGRLRLRRRPPLRGRVPCAPACAGTGTTLVVLADLRDGLPTSADEAAGGDGAAALLVGDDAPGTPVIAEYLGGASVSDEFLDRWRTPGDRRSKVWEERFGETRYVPLGTRSLGVGAQDGRVAADQVDQVAVAGMHARAVKALTRKLGVANDALADDLNSTVGQTGAAHRAWCSPRWSSGPSPARCSRWCRWPTAPTSSSSGPPTPAPRGRRRAGGRPDRRRLPTSPTASFCRGGAWSPPSHPGGPSPTGVVVGGLAQRGLEVRLRRFAGPELRGGAPAPVADLDEGGAVDDMDPVEMADTEATIATFTIDRLAYSPSPPIVFAVLDFDGGGRFPVELTDVDPGPVGSATGSP